MVDIDALVAKCKADGASDLHLICGLPPKYRKDGQLQDMSDTPLTKQDCEDMARFLAGDQYEKMAKIGEVAFPGHTLSGASSPAGRDPQTREPRPAPGSHGPDPNAQGHHPCHR